MSVSKLSKNYQQVIERADKLDLDEFNELLQFLDENYYDGEGIISDDEYDNLLDIYEAKYGVYKTKTEEKMKDKVELPYFLSSLRKIKKETEVATWLKNYPGPYVVEDKVDGLTLLLVSKNVNNRRETNLFTKGKDGIYGRDVSNLLNYLTLPIDFGDINEIYVRGEIMITKDDFIQLNKQQKFKNARNTASGIINTKNNIDQLLIGKLTFYAYRIMNSNNTPQQDVVFLQNLGFNVANPVYSENLSFEVLDNYLNKRKQESPYDIDGLVIYQDKYIEYPQRDNPRHVIAFKNNTDSAITEVVDVKWQTSQHRLLKPVINYQPINLSGATLSRASGYNARYIIDNKIGPGAKILVTRSGDVIPKIQSIISPSSVVNLYPDDTIYGKYAWNDTGVELILLEDNQEVVISKLRHFVEVLDIKSLGSTRLKYLVEFGVVDIYDLLTITPEKLTTISNIGPVLSNNIHKDLHDKITNVGLPTIMDASGIFPNIGEKRFQLILQAYPDFISQAEILGVGALTDLIKNIKGFDTLALKIAQNVPVFIDWLKIHSMIKIKSHLPSPKFNITSKLNNITVVFSGFRDKILENQIKQCGGKVTTSVSKNTNFLIMKDLLDVKGKALSAKNLGISLISKDDFVEKYL